MFMGTFCLPGNSQLHTMPGLGFFALFFMLTQKEKRAILKSQAAPLYMVYENSDKLVETSSESIKTATQQHTELANMAKKNNTEGYRVVKAPELHAYTEEFGEDSTEVQLAFLKVARQDRSFL